MELARVIDHTVLKPEATADDVRRLIEEALAHRFAAVCVNGRFVAEAVRALRGTGVAVCGVVDFPLGAGKETVRSIEATAACKDGATEIDFVAHLPHLLSKDLERAREDFLAITRPARSVNPDVVVKVILETAALMRDVDAEEAAARIEVGCLAAREAGCDYVKTSTGFHPAGGATVEAVRLLRRFAGPMKVKAAGGIRTLADARAMLDAGADRLGCSASVAIVAEARRSDAGAGAGGGGAAGGRRSPAT